MVTPPPPLPVDAPPGSPLPPPAPAPLPPRPASPQQRHHATADRDLLEQLLDAAVHSTLSSRPPLVSAAASGQDLLLHRLLQRFVASVGDVHPQLCKDIASALLAAADAGHAGSVAALLDSADALTNLDHLVAATGEGQRTPLMLAAARGHARVIRLLLTHNPEGQVAAVDTGKMTALMLAAEAGHASCLDLLLQHTPEKQVSAAGPRRMTALMLAARAGNTACIAPLMRFCPQKQVAALDAAYCTALSMAAERGHAGVTSVLLSHQPPQRHLHRALQRTARLMPSRLHAAALADAPELAGRWRCLELLLAKGAQLPWLTRLPCICSSNDAVVQSVIQDLASRALDVNVQGKGKELASADSG